MSTQQPQMDPPPRRVVRDPGDTRPHLAEAPPVIRRLVVALCCALLFFTVATFSGGPHNTKADVARIVVHPALSEKLQRTGGLVPTVPTNAAIDPQGTVRAQPAQPAKAPIRDSAGRPLLGTLDGRNLHVWIYGDKHQPLYTVVNDIGQVRLKDAQAQDVYRVFPELPIHDLRLDGGAIMLMDQKE